MHLEIDVLKLGEFDVSAFADAVANLPEDEWSKDDGRQEKFDVHADTQTIWLIYDADFRHKNPTRREMMDVFEPLAAPVMNYLMENYPLALSGRINPEQSGPGYFVRVILTRLCAGGEITEHADGGISLKRCHRIHLPIITNDHCQFKVGDTVMNMRAGELWEINNRAFHAVKNEGSAARVHMILDYVQPGEVIHDPKGTVVA